MPTLMLLLVTGSAAVVWLVAGSVRDGRRRRVSDEHRRRVALLRILAARLPEDAVVARGTNDPTARGADWRVVAVAPMRPGVGLRPRLAVTEDAAARSGLRDRRDPGEGRRPAGVLAASRRLRPFVPPV